MKRIAAATIAIVLAASAHAAITTTGLIDPADPSTWGAATWGKIGNNGGGTMVISDGSDVVSQYGTIAYGSGSVGAATVTGAGSTWTNSATFFVGGDGTGSLNIQLDGLLDCGSSGVIGDEAGSVGTATVQSGGTWTLSSSLFVGQVGNGTLNIQSAGTVSNTNGIIADVAGSTGTATVDGAGSTWTNSGSLSVGYYGNGTLTIQNGGAVSNTYGSIGDESGSTGTATVTGAGSTWTNTSDLIVGESGTGTLNVESGGSVSSVTGFVGYSDDTTGTATVTGTDSTWTNSDYLTIGDNGNGTLTIADGGAVSNTQGYIGYGDSAVGTVTVDNGQWTNNSSLYVGDGGTGTLTIENGGTVDNTSGNIGYESTSTGTVTVDNGTWTNTGALSIGRDGTGTLTVQNGGSVSNTFAYVGNRTGSTGTATVTGTGSSWTSANSLYVGNVGNGTLTIANGGAVNNANGFIGYAAGVTGVVTVTGANSSWTNATPLYVGHSGTGTLNITSGGAVSNTIGYIGREIGSVGTATVDGADSTWTNSDYLDVGVAGTGTLNITDGGAVSSTDGIIAHNTGSVGTVTVNNSTWTATSSFIVGQSGAGTLNIENGGEVSSAVGRIGRFSTSTGTVSVDGSGSSWTNTGAFYIGDSGTGTLNISNGGVVTALSAYINAASTLSGDGTLTLNSGSGTLSNDGTIAPGNSIGTLTVDGDVTFEDGSMLEVEVDNAGNCDLLDVSGDVTINGGTVAANSNGETITGEQSYTIITAGGAGGVTGTFTTLDTALLDLEAENTAGLEYGSDAVVLNVTAGSFEAPTILRTDNQRSLGTALQAAANGGELLAINSALQGIVGDGNLRRAYDQLSGQTRPSVAPIIDAGMSGFTGVVFGRMQGKRRANLGSSGTMFAMADDNTFAFNSLSSAIVTDVAAVGTAGQSSTDSKYGLWTKGFGARGDRDGKDGVNGYDYEIAGVALGLDYRFTDNLLAGVTFGYSDTDVEYNDSRDNSRIDSYYGGLYGSYRDSEGYIDGIFTYADLDSETDRYVDFLGEKNEGDFDGYEVSTYVEAARNYYFNDVLVQPLGGFEFGYQNHDGYTEEGGSSALRYEEQSFESYKGSLGVKASKNIYKKGEQNLWAQLRAKWMHEFGDAAAGITASFASTPGYRFSIRDSKLDRDSAVLGAGLKYELNRNSMLYADYDTVLNGDAVAYIFSGGLRFLW